LTQTKGKMMTKFTTNLFLLVITSNLVGCLPAKNSETQPIEQPQVVTDSKPKPSAPMPQQPARDKHALLIGIENYRKAPPLRGTINDVQLMKGLLRQHFGFQEQNIITLLDEQATHTGIENAFTTLIERIKPKDFVYIHYSGHGSQTQDLNGDELHGQDQTWVSYGTRQPGRHNDKDNYDILDDEINAWLAALYAKTDQIILVSDSCHSATVARGSVPVTRGLKRDERTHPLGKKTYTQLKNYQGIHIGSARDKEFAAETRRNDGKHYGLFTWHWAKALQQAQIGQTWNEIFKRAYTAVVAIRGDAQKPQIEGQRHRQIFGNKISPPTATVSVTEVNGERIKIQSGTIAGVTVGSVYRLHQHRRVSSKLDTQTLPRLEITQVSTFQSEGKAVGTFKLKRGDLVVEESHAYHFDPIKVYLSADEPQDQALLQNIQAAFNAAKLPGYVLTNIADNSDLRLHLLRPKRENGKNGQAIYESEHDALPQSFSNQPPELWVLTPDLHLLHKNLQIQFNNPKTGVERLKENLNKLARIREMKALQNRHNGNRNQPIQMQAEIFTPVTTCPNPNGANCIVLETIDLGLHQKSGPYPLAEIEKRQFNPGELISFSLHNQSKQDYYCYLINLSTDGAIYALYPNSKENEEYALIKAGEKRELFDEAMLMTEQSGEETIKLIASKQPIEVLLLEQDAFKRNRKLNPLERLLVSAAQGLRGLSRVQNYEWMTEQVSFQVK
jgi:hypothetical protein